MPSARWRNYILPKRFKNMTDKTIGTFEINVLDVREQIQEDILSCLEMHNCSFRVQLADDLCQMVVDNFEKLRVDESYPDGYFQGGRAERDKRLQEYLERQDFFEDTEDLS